MNKALLLIDQTKRTLTKESYAIGGSDVKRTGILQIPLVSVQCAEMNTLVVSRLSGKTEYYQILDSFSDGTCTVRELV